LPIGKLPTFYGTRIFITSFTKACLFPERDKLSRNPCCFSRIYFNIILPTTSTSSHWSFSFWFLYQNRTCTFIHATCRAHSNNVLWGKQGKQQTKEGANNKQETSTVACFIYFCPEDGCSWFLWNVGEVLPDCISSYPRRCNVPTVATSNPESVQDVTLFYPVFAEDETAPLNNVRINHSLVMSTKTRACCRESTMECKIN
jgi:hypothetical protein